MPEATDIAGPQARVREIVEEVIKGTPMYVIDVAVHGHMGTYVVNVYLESEDVLDVAALTRINRELGFRLDEDGAVGEKYALNVSSPGVDRPLVDPRQYRKNIGRELLVKFNQEDGVASVRGELTAANDVEIELRVRPDQILSIPFERIISAKVQLPW